jgi:hypothetical protein
VRAICSSGTFPIASANLSSCAYVTNATMSDPHMVSEMFEIAYGTV